MDPKFLKGNYLLEVTEKITKKKFDLSKVESFEFSRKTTSFYFCLLRILGDFETTTNAITSICEDVIETRGCAMGFFWNIMYITWGHFPLEGNGKPCLSKFLKLLKKKKNFSASYIYGKATGEIGDFGGQQIATQWVRFDKFDLVLQEICSAPPGLKKKFKDR